MKNAGRLLSSITEMTSLIGGSTRGLASRQDMTAIIRESNQRVSSRPDMTSLIAPPIRRAATGSVAALARIKHQEMLDRNRYLKGMTYTVAGTDKFNEVQELLYQSFHPDEPLTAALGLGQNKGDTILDADNLVLDTLDQHLSLFSLNSQGRPVGVCVNRCLARHHFTASMDEDIVTVRDPRYQPITAIVNTLRHQCVEIFSEIGTDQLFSISMVGVHPDFRNKGVATDLIRRSILLAGCLGFEGIITEATGNFSRKAFATIGMVPVAHISYGDFEFEGRKPFSAITDQQGVTLMQKKFFQSCLRHIL